MFIILREILIVNPFLREVDAVKEVLSLEGIPITTTEPPRFEDITALSTAEPSSPAASKATSTPRPSVKVKSVQLHLRLLIMYRLPRIHVRFPIDDLIYL